MDVFGFDNIFIWFGEIQLKRDFKVHITKDIETCHFFSMQNPCVGVCLGKEVFKAITN